MSLAVTDAAIEPPPPSPAPKVRPGKAWYWVFGVVLVASVVAALAIWLIGRYQVEERIKNFARFLAPGEADLDFKRGGRYVLYYEYAGTLDDTELQAEPSVPVGLELEMLDRDGQPVRLDRLSDELTYDAGGFAAISVRRVDLDGRGMYHISATAPADGDGEGAHVGRGDAPSTENTDRAALLVGIIGGAIGLIGLVATGIARARARARLAGWTPGPPASGGPPPLVPVPGPSPAAPESAVPTGEPSVPPPPPAAPAGPAFSPTAPLPVTAPPSPPPPPPPPPATVGASPAPASSGGWAPPTPGSAADPREAPPAPPVPPPPPET